MNSAFVFASGRLWSLNPRQPVSRCPVPRCVASSSTNDGDSGVNDWLDMARSLGNGRPESDPSRPAPVWEYPEGRDFSTPQPPEVGVDGQGEEGRLANPWATWSKALGDEPFAEPQNLASRDPREETDFWRSTARDLAASSAEMNVGGTGENEDDSHFSSRDVVMPSGSEYADPAVPSDQQGLWNAASQVTTSMIDMQDRLRGELESFNPYEKSDAYRDAAKQILGADRSSQPSSTEDDHRESSKPEPVAEEQDEQAQKSVEQKGIDANSGSGWNPDVDWTRFDDVAREAQLKADMSQRAEAQKDAERKRREAVEKMNMFDYSPSGQSSFTFTDTDGKVLSQEEVAAAIAEGAVLIDENGNELAAADVSAPSSSTDTTIPSHSDKSISSEGSAGSSFSSRNRLRSQTAYGPDASDFAREMQLMLERGESLRDPEADKNFWRSAAREISSSETSSKNGKTETNANHKLDGLRSAEPESSEPETQTTGDRTDSVADLNVSSNVQEKMVSSGEKVSDKPDTDYVQTSESSQPAPVSNGESEASSWAAWQSGRETWQKTVENAAPRDPKAEVDMWRDTARDLVSDSSQDPSSATSPSKDDSVTATGSTDADKEDSDPWNAWNAANLSWKQQLETVDDTSSDNNIDKWRKNARDLGAVSDEDAVSGSNTKSARRSEPSRDAGSLADDSGSSWSTWPSTVRRSGSEPNTSETLGSRSAWWGSRADVPRRNTRNTKFPSEHEDGGIGRWKTAAKGMKAGDGSSVEPGENVGDLPKRQASTGDGIEFWKDFAKDFMPPSDSATESADGDES